MLCVIRVVNYPLASLSIFYAFVQEVICQAAHDGMIMGILDKINGQIFKCSRLFWKSVLFFWILKQNVLNCRYHFWSPSEISSQWLSDLQFFCCSWFLRSRAVDRTNKVLVYAHHCPLSSHNEKAAIKISISYIPICINFSISLISKFSNFMLAG